jgi:phosphopantothenoylcysteine decarboxylase/phosphopantothenate--cysteine ligase
MKNSLFQKNIVLGVCGGIAAYKSILLLRLMTAKEAQVRVIMTPHACEFVGPLTFEALSGNPVWTDLFDKTRSDGAIRHIQWAQEAQAVVIAPATANILAKFANGIADDSLSTFFLAATCPIVLCPSMNTDMYLSAPVQRNLKQLQKDGHIILEPETGDLACGTTGPGRLPEPEQILDRLRACLTKKDLSGKTVLVTAGPTQEPIDPVRFISNPSSGKMGYALAKAAEHRGARVILVTGPTHLPDLLNVKMIKIRTAREMADAVFDHLDQSDIVIKSAAVSDYRPKEEAKHKIKKSETNPVLVLEQTEDILKTIGRLKTRQFLVGFAAETQSLQENALEKLEKKNLDMIAGNLVTHPGSGFGTDTNRITLFYRNGTREALAQMDKEAAAHVILDRIIMRLA